MSDALAYLPLDRRYALSQGGTLPDQTTGSVLFADSSGFTLLTETLLHHFGPRRGADELARHFNHVFNQLISTIDRHGGSVISFAGDSITCWFDDQLPEGSQWSEPALGTPSGEVQSNGLLRSLAAAVEMQRAMDSLAEIQIGDSASITLALKIAISAGSVRRFLIGDPDVQVIEVLAGKRLDQVAGAESVAQAGDILLDQATAQRLPPTLVKLGPSRQDDNRETFVPLVAFNAQIAPVTLPALDALLDERLIRRWVLPPVYARIHSQERFLAEIRPAAALFIKFSGIDYEADPHAGEKLDRYIRWVQSIANRFQGSLIQLTTGDKGSYLYLAFGAPIAHDDNAERSAAAALALRDLPPELTYINRLQMGITQGRMRVGAYGGRTRQTYAVLGDATNLAARLMSRASYGQILVNQQAADEIGGQFELQDLGFATMKGKSEPEALFALNQLRAQQADRLRSRYTTPLLGREDELAQVDQLIIQTLAAESQILRIEGEAGIGKSHLAATILQRAQQQGMETWVGGCQSTGQESAYLPIRQIMRQLLNLPPVEATNSTAQQQMQIHQVEAMLQSMNPDWLVRMPLLGDLLGLPIADTPTTAAFEPQLRREALTTLVIDMVQSAARHRPLLILIEDIHWMDEASQELLIGLGRSLHTQPILIMLMHRPLIRAGDWDNQGTAVGATADAEMEMPEGSHGFLARWKPLVNQTHIRLTELSSAGTAALVAHRLASQAISPLALELIQGLAQGNPFYIEELVDALLDSEQLMPVDGTWVLTRPVISALRNANYLIREGDQWRLRADTSLSEIDLGIPDSIHGIVLARLDRLPESVKLTLKVASVIGHVFEFNMLAEAHPASVAPADLMEQIALVEERDFARMDTPDPLRRYIFRHNITQEVVYRTLLDEQRLELHLAVAQAVERFQPDAVERLAYHYHSSDLTQPDTRSKALHYLGTAADRAKRDYANETALTFYDRGLVLEERWNWMKSKIELYHLLGQRQEELELLDYAQYAKLGPEVELALLRSIYCESISEYEEAQSAVDLALSLSQQQQDRTNEARSLIQVGQIAGRQGDFAQKEASLVAALERTDQAHLTAAEEIEIRYGLGIVYRERSEYAEAQKALGEALALAHHAGDRSREAMILSGIGFTYQLQRQFGEAYEHNASALKVAQEIGDRQRESSGLVSIAQVLLEGKGDIYQASVALLNALKIQESIGNLWWQALIWNTLGVAYNDVGEYQSAEESIRRGIQIIEEIGFEAGRGHLLCNLGEAYRESKDLEVAIQVLNESLAIALQHQDRATQAYSYAELAATYVLAQEYNEAIKNAELALQIQEDLEMVMLTASSLAVLAFAHQKMHRPDKALAYAIQAVEILDKCQGLGPQYPQRAYHHCYQVFNTNSDDKSARKALQAGYNLIAQQAEKISNPQMRTSFLTNVSTNRLIHAEMVRLGLVDEY